MNETKYQARLGSYHKSKPKFYRHITRITAPFIAIGHTVKKLIDDFDLDSAIGHQQDRLGLWIGLTRNIQTPLDGVYFSLDTAELGLDQGTWKGAHDALSGLTRIDDDTYRTLLRAKIQANHWDGTVETLSQIYQGIFPDGKTQVFAVDNFDMTMSIYITGEQISSVMKAVIAQGYLDVKPAGVAVKNYMISSRKGALFGFDINNAYVAGCDNASWGLALMKVKHG